MRSHLHSHAEDECAALAQTFRSGHDSSAVFQYNLLDHCQSETYAIVVLIGCSVEPAKLREKFRQALSIYPHPSVPHVHHQELIILVVAHLDVNSALGSEFERVLQQVNHHLLEPPFVANQERQITISIRN